jgi:hypothetical protein
MPESEKLVDGWRLTIETAPERLSSAASCATRARQDALRGQPSMRASISAALPAASALTRLVIAVCSAPLALNARASSALMMRNTSTPRATRESRDRRRNAR